MSVTVSVASSGSFEADIHASDFERRSDFTAALEDALADARSEVTVAAQPPMPSSMSAVDVLEDVSRLRPAVPVRLIVESERMRATLDDHLPRYAPVEQRPHCCWTIVEPLRISMRVGDIVEGGTQAIVNASNTRLELGGGVSGALKRAASPGLQAEMFVVAARQEIRPGDVLVTGAHGVAGATWILHAATVAGGCDVVERALRGVLAVCKELGVRSVTVPCLGTGTGGLSLEDFGRVCGRVLTDLRDGTNTLEEVVLVCWTASAFRIVERELIAAWGPAKATVARTMETPPASLGHASDAYRRRVSLLVVLASLATEEDVLCDLLRAALDRYRVQAWCGNERRGLTDAGAILRRVLATQSVDVEQREAIELTLRELDSLEPSERLQEITLRATGLMPQD